MPVNFEIDQQAQLEAFRRAQEASSQRAALLTDTGRSIAQTAQAYLERNSAAQRDLWRIGAELANTRLSAETTMRGQDIDRSIAEERVRADIYNQGLVNSLNAASANQSDRTSRANNAASVAASRYATASAAATAERRLRHDMSRAMVEDLSAGRGGYNAVVNPDGSINYAMHTSILNFPRGEGRAAAREVLYGNGGNDVYRNFINRAARKVSAEGGVDINRASSAIHTFGVLPHFSDVMNEAIDGAKRLVEKGGGINNPRAVVNTLMYGNGEEEDFKSMQDIEKYVRKFPKNSAPPNGITQEQHQAAHGAYEEQRLALHTALAKLGGKEAQDASVYEGQ